ncbi:hypothetical protein PINS_up007504 [Pythium insidiosum]|nr:hypothetical protein PINS_up007504 [Pythium insidiosum]
MDPVFPPTRYAPVLLKAAERPDDESKDDDREDVDMERTPIDDVVSDASASTVRVPGDDGQRQGRRRRDRGPAALGSFADSSQYARNA